MKINVLCMCYNSQKFIKEVIENWRRIGTVNIFIDIKTTDNTEMITRNLGITPQFFTFKDFASARNEILSKFPNGYRIFIDDSYLFIGDPKAFVRELYSRGDEVISIKMVKDNIWFSYSKITKGSVRYRDLVHEYVEKPASYQIENGYIRELSCKEHLIRTLNRIPWDLEILFESYYKNRRNERAVFYICQSLLNLYRFEFCSKRLVLYWLVQLKTMPGRYNHIGKFNYEQVQKN